MAARTDAYVLLASWCFTVTSLKFVVNTILNILLDSLILVGLPLSTYDHSYFLPMMTTSNELSTRCTYHHFVHLKFQLSLCTIVQYAQSTGTDKRDAVDWMLRFFKRRFKVLIKSYIKSDTLVAIVCTCCTVRSWIRDIFTKTSS